MYVYVDIMGVHVSPAAQPVVSMEHADFQMGTVIFVQTGTMANSAKHLVLSGACLVLTQPIAASVMMAGMVAIVKNNVSRTAGFALLCPIALNVTTDGLDPTAIELVRTAAEEDFVKYRVDCVRTMNVSLVG